MGYRAPISDEVHKRVQLYMVGQTGNNNEVYEDGARMLIDSSGEPRDMYNMMFDQPGEVYDWVSRVKKYANDNDVDEGEVLEAIITNVIDEDGSAELKFKGKMGL